MPIRSDANMSSPLCTSLAPCGNRFRTGWPVPEHKSPLLISLYIHSHYSFLVSVSRFSSRLVFALLLYCCFCPLPDTAANLRSILFIARQSFSFVTGSQRHPLAPRYTTLSPPTPNFFFLLFSITRVWYSNLTHTPTCLLTSSPCSRSPRLWSPPRLPCP